MGRPGQRTSSPLAHTRINSQRCPSGQAAQHSCCLISLSNPGEVGFQPRQLQAARGETQMRKTETEREDGQGLWRTSATDLLVMSTSDRPLSGTDGL